MVKYIVGVLVLAVFVFFGVTLFRAATKDDNKKPVTTVAVKKLPDYANSDAKVSVSIIGPVVGSEERRQVRVTVSRTSRTIEVVRGYQNNVITARTYPNDQAAFDVFLRALNGYGFTSSKKPRVSDQYSACPTGTLYVYELSNTGSPDTDKYLWSVSCGPELGTFAGGPGPTLRTLFEKQIPDYDELTKDVDLK